MMERPKGSLLVFRSCCEKSEIGKLLVEKHSDQFAGDYCAIHEITGSPSLEYFISNCLDPFAGKSATEATHTVFSIMDPEIWTG
jgi:hypothetical protein